MDKWKDFIGQGESIELLKKLDRAGKRTHVLLHGPPGTGKTTLAKILSRGNMVSCIGSMLKNPERMGAVIESALENGIDTLFIDEVHSAKSRAIEILYPVMEEGVLYNGTETERDAKIHIIAATTDGGRLSKAFVDRFGVEVRLRLYDKKEMAKIVKEMTKKYKVSLTTEMIEDVASKSIGVPRVARKLVQRLSDFDKEYTDKRKYDEIIELTGIDPDGLGVTERQVLKSMWYDFNNGPIGIRTLAFATQIDEYMLSKTVEPTLIRLGYLNIEKTGRRLTVKGVSRALQIP